MVFDVAEKANVLRTSLIECGNALVKQIELALDDVSTDQLGKLAE